MPEEEEAMTEVAAAANKMLSPNILLDKTNKAIAVGGIPKCL
jgi:hypothetical protein